MAREDLRSSTDACPAASHQAKRLETGDPVTADDQVVMDADAQAARRLDDLSGDLHVGLRRRRIAGRVVVHEPVKIGKVRK